MGKRQADQQIISLGEEYLVFREFLTWGQKICTVILKSSLALFGISHCSRNFYNFG